MTYQTAGDGLRRLSSWLSLFGAAIVRLRNLTIAALMPEYRLNDDRFY